MEVEDDVFFADLSRQVALLVMDDDEEFPAQYPPSIPVKACPSVPPQYMMPLPYAYEMASSRESKGTGVFIPRSSCPKRKSSRSGRHNATNMNGCKQHDKTGSVSSHANNKNHVSASFCKSSGLQEKRTEEV